MTGWLDWGVAVVQWFQANMAWAVPLARFLSFLGTEEGILICMPLLYWCIDTSFGIRLGIVLGFTASAGSLLKMVFHMPRPYWYDRGVQPLAAEPTYGMPSMHAMFSAAVWPWLGERIRHGWGLAAGILLALAVALARILLGVHFPQDVLAGLILGAAIWWAVVWGIDRLGPVLRNAGTAIQILCAALASAAFLLLQALVLMAIAGVKDPAVWAENAARIAAIAPRDPVQQISMAGLIFGIGTGVACMVRWAPFRADGPLSKRAIRFVVGLIGLLAVWRGLAVIFPVEPQTVGYILRYMRYGLTGLWATFLAPWVFIRLGLAEAEGQAREKAAGGLR